jgi:ATP-binding cassette subfamily B protein
MLRPPEASRLVILDEPFLGLERDRRRSVLTCARQHWAASTLLYVTHDVGETRAFDRVLVVEHGRIVEDGAPRELAQSPTSRYRHLLQSQEAVLNRLVGDGEWRRIRMESGQIVHGHLANVEQTA